ncbi:syndecan-3 isoform X2 [Notamacropus eugenii]|uniref:syndecan-3 isoform X2 n=1 Tax=Notamacropus eugenii TaxID=9315 RepID=UPI003B685F16
MKPGPPHRAGAGAGAGAGSGSGSGAGAGTGAGAGAGAGARGMLLPPLLLLLLAGRAAGAQRWRSENFERPVDLEGSGDDDSFPDDELDDHYSGSGSGYFEQESGIEKAVRISTNVAVALSTTPAVLPTSAIQPMGTPFEMQPSESPTPKPATTVLAVTKVSVVPMASATTATTATATEAVTTVALAVATEAPAVATVAPAVATAAAATTNIIPTTASIPTYLPSTISMPVSQATALPKLPPPPPATVAATVQATVQATAQATAPATLTLSAVASDLDTEVSTPKLVVTATPGTLPNPETSQPPGVFEKSTVAMGSDALVPTEVPQTPTPEAPLATNREVEAEVPFPSGDSEPPEEGITQPELDNEVVAVGEKTTTTSAGVKPKDEQPGPGLFDNTIDLGNSAAQLPQKNILERKEVLVAVIVGGVVGALFAAFLVTLLIYRMKKKDEGSYTLEEPKQASVTYQKPDKQEEFYA